MDCSQNDSAGMRKYRETCRKLREHLIQTYPGVPKICHGVERELQYQDELRKSWKARYLFRDSLEKPDDIAEACFLTSEQFGKFVNRLFSSYLKRDILRTIIDYLDSSGVVCFQFLACADTWGREEGVHF
eukprot:m.287086 g.287086  ORF g.287086 m.287086 type:complete len:130 (+) comp40701_c0_seq47:3225-3614(+)